MDTASLYDIIVTKEREIERLREWLRIIRDDETKHEYEFATEALCGCDPASRASKRPQQGVVLEGFR